MGMKLYPDMYRPDIYFFCNMTGTAKGQRNVLSPVHTGADFPSGTGPADKKIGVIAVHAMRTSTDPTQAWTPAPRPT